MRNFLALARQRPPERAEVRLGQVIEGAVELLAYELRSDGVEVAIDIAADLPKLWADPHQLHQVFVNLITNAYHAMRGQPGPRRIGITAGRDVGADRVRLEFADTGPGIPPEIQAKMFEPFFTTKPTGEGTGLGLSLCRGIIEDHGGAITVESAPGRGARFVIELPVTDRAGAAAPSDSGVVLPPVTPKVVLVVDDEPDVAAVAAEALERDGHRTEIARNGAMALEMLATRRYDLIISDTKMPVLDGEAFYRELGHRFPALRDRVIFITGDALSRDKRDFLERTGAPFLTKPFDLGEMRGVVRRMFADTDSPANRTP